MTPNNNRYFSKNYKYAIIAIIAKRLSRLSLSVDHFRALCGPIFPLRPLSPIALCSLYGPLTPLWPFNPSMALYPLYGPLPPLGSPIPLWPSVPSTALCPLYAPLSPLKNSEKSETTLLFNELFSKRVSSKLQGLSRSISYK
jgi:hypothetical protein